MSPNPWLLLPAALLAGLGLFHSAMGERYIVRRLLRRPDLPSLFGDDSFTRITIRYAWHLTTIFCLLAAAILLLLSLRPLETSGASIAKLIALSLIVAGIWGIVSTSGRHWSWVVLFVAGGLVVVGAT